MSRNNLSVLHESLLRRPEPAREKLAGYIVAHLDEIEDEMHWSEDPTFLSPELQSELERREAEAVADPEDGVSWEELQARLLASG